MQLKTHCQPISRPSVCLPFVYLFVSHMFQRLSNRCKANSERCLLRTPGTPSFYHIPKYFFLTYYQYRCLYRPSPTDLIPALALPFFPHPLTSYWWKCVLAFLLMWLAFICVRAGWRSGRAFKLGVYALLFNSPQLRNHPRLDKRQAAPANAAYNKSAGEHSSVATI